MQTHLLAAILSAVFIALVGIGIIAPVMPIYATELGASGFALGVIVAGFSLSRGLLQPVVGGLADRHGKKRFMIAGLFIYAAMGYSYTLATSVEHLVAVRIVHGMGSAMIIPMAMAYIGDMSPEGQEGKYMGWLHISIFTGIGGGPVIGGFFLDFWGMNSAFYAMASLSLLSLLLVAVLLPEQMASKRKENQGSMLSIFRRMLRSRRVIGILISRMATMMIMIPTVAFLPVLMEKTMDAGGIEIGVVVASRTLVNAVLQTPFGKIADRWHKHRLIFIGSTIISIAMLIVPFSGNFINLVILFLFIGLGESISWPALGALATVEGREYGQGSMMGMFNMAMSAGLFFGAMGMGALTDLLSISWAFYIVALILFLSTVVAVELIRKTNGKGTDEAWIS